MSSFKLKTHQIGRTYSNPHFFILNKGLNSGKPLIKPCPNCFVVIATNEADKNTLFHLSLMLQIGGFYAYYLKGSVIPFISVKDCIEVLKNAIDESKISSDELQNQINTIAAICHKEEALKITLFKIGELKKAYIQTYFRINLKSCV